MLQAINWTNIWRYMGRWVNSSLLWIALHSVKEIYPTIVSWKLVDNLPQKKADSLNLFIPASLIRDYPRHPGAGLDRYIRLHVLVWNPVKRPPLTVVLDARWYRVIVGVQCIYSWRKISEPLQGCHILYRFGSTLVQVMACCLTVPSHYLNHYWLIISEVQWQSVRAISQHTSQPLIIKIRLKKFYVKFHLNFPGTDDLINMSSVHKVLLKGISIHIADV